MPGPDHGPSPGSHVQGKQIRWHMVALLSSWALSNPETCRMQHASQLYLGPHLPFLALSKKYGRVQAPAFLFPKKPHPSRPFLKTKVAMWSSAARDTMVGTRRSSKAKLPSCGEWVSPFRTSALAKATHRTCSAPLKYVQTQKSD